MICVVLLQDYMSCVEGETGSSGETDVTCGVDGTREVGIKVEDSIDIKEEVGIKFEAVYIKDEVAETTGCPPFETDHEVRLWGVCELGGISCL
jgi:hypothetical protein